MSRPRDVVVVGGGVIGCAVTWSLARQGVSVTLLERDDLAAQASGAAAGMLLPYGESRAPGAFLAWGERALAGFPALCEELRAAGGIDPEFEASGALHVALDAGDEESLRAKLEVMPAAAFEWLEPPALRKLEPGLATAARGALWSPHEAHVRSPLLTRAYAAAAETVGARVERGVVVHALSLDAGRCTGVATSRGRYTASAVVLCGGAWTPQLAPFELPIEPVRGQIASLDNPAPPLRHIAVADDVYLVPKRDGSLVVGATQERTGFDRRVTLAGVAGLLGSARELAPLLGETGFRGAWAGLRPASPDGLPLVGAAPGVSGLFVAAGHFRNGVLLSAVTGQLVAAALLDKPLPAGAEAFRPGRFGTPGAGSA